MVKGSLGCALSQYRRRKRLTVALRKQPCNPCDDVRSHDVELVGSCRMVEQASYLLSCICSGSSNTKRPGDGRLGLAQHGVARTMNTRR